MKSELVEHSAVRKELKIEIPADTVQAAHQRISQNYARYATLPGFRQGRAPLSIVQRRYKDEIASETLRELVGPAVEEAINEHHLQPVGDPEVHLEGADGLKELGVATVSLHAHVEVMPQVEVKEYKGLEGIRRMRPIPDEAVEKIIDERREEEAYLEPVGERAAQDGDTVTVTLHGHVVDGEQEDFDFDDTEIEVGGENTLAEFSEALRGAQIDDERAFTVQYPEGFSTEELAGQEVAYTLRVEGVHVKQLPDADDEWAQSLDEGYESLADLQNKIRADLEEDVRREAHDRLRGELFNQLIDAHEFEVPRAFVEMQADRLLEDTARRFAAIGLDPRNMKREFWQNLRNSLIPQAERDVRGMFLVERIAEIEGIEVTPEEVETYLEETAEAIGRPLEEVRDALTKDDGERSIAASLRNRKTLDFLVENANVTDGEWIEPGPPPLTEEAAETELPEAAEEAEKAESASSEA
jgi:trigger factor